MPSRLFLFYEERTIKDKMKTTKKRWGEISIHYFRRCLYLSPFFMDHRCNQYAEHREVLQSLWTRVKGLIATQEQISTLTQLVKIFGKNVADKSRLFFTNDPGDGEVGAETGEKKRSNSRTIIKIFCTEDSMRNFNFANAFDYG